MRRRDWQKEQTRFDLALAAFELAKAEGLANVRVPQIAEVVGVSTRTFNNYFSSKEAAIVWPTALRGARLAADLAERPAGEPLADALVEVVAGMYGPAGQAGLPAGWLDGFRTLVATEPSLHGEYLKAQAAGERELAQAIAARTPALGRRGQRSGTGRRPALVPASRALHPTGRGRPDRARHGLARDNRRRRQPLLIASQPSPPERNPSCCFSSEVTTVP
jgi:AcrR family transcriptional regulator